MNTDLENTIKKVKRMKIDIQKTIQTVNDEYWLIEHYWYSRKYENRHTEKYPDSKMMNTDL